MLSKHQKKLLTLRPSDEEEDVVDLQAKGQPVEQDGEPEELSAPVNKRAHTAPMRSAPAPTRTTTKRNADDDHDDDDDIREIIPAKSSGRPKRQTASSSRPKQNKSWHFTPSQWRSCDRDETKLGIELVCHGMYGGSCI